MSIQLQNNLLTITVSEKGAELSSIKSADGLEYLWQGDPIYWGRKAPILFPIVGRLKNDHYEINGHKFTLGQHGFARDCPFTIKRQNDTMISLSLSSDQTTKAMYPFDFHLNVTYTLEGNTVGVSYQVENTSDEDMWFSIGAHPGFNVPLVENTSFEDYYISFSPNYVRSTIPLAGPYLDLVNKSDTPPNLNIPLKRSLFDNDALIFETVGKNTLILQSDKTDHRIQLSYDGFPYIGIWSPPQKEAPFICLEPWYGIADEINASGDLKEKLGIIQLEGHSLFSAHYDITFD